MRERREREERGADAEEEDRLDEDGLEEAVANVDGGNISALTTPRRL